MLEGRGGTEPVSHGDLLPTQVVYGKSTRIFLFLLQLLVLRDCLAYYGEDTLAVPVAASVAVGECERACVMLAARKRKRTS